MGEGHAHHGFHHQLSLHHLAHHHGQQPPPAPPPPPPRSRFGGGVRAAAGEIVEVQGGHIVRSTGRKDRHSKVCTAKGPRDRRVRLSAHTAIQFYDVQDRLGYDRPSKAVDWLIKNAKAAIDELAELPAWHPTSTPTANAAAGAGPGPSAANPAPQPNPHDTHHHSPGAADQAMDDSSGKRIPIAGGSSFIPPSLDSDAIADTIKSFFPTAAATAPSPSPSIGFQNYPPPDLLSRTSSQTQDLRLSLQSFQDPIFHSPHHPHHHGQRHQSPSPAQHHHSLFSGSTPLAFDTSSSGWSEQNQRLVPWNVVAEAGGGGGGGGDFMFNVPPPPQAAPMHPVLGQSHFFSQRGPLQSSNLLSVRAWSDQMAAAPDHQMHPALHPSGPSIGFTSGAGFSGFRIPARIQGEEEHGGGGMSDKPPSASSASHH